MSQDTERQTIAGKRVVYTMPGVRNAPSLDASDLAHRLEVSVAGVQYEVVLQYQCRNPQVVGRDRCPLPAKLPVHRGVEERGLIVRVEDGYAVLLEEPAQDSFFLRRTPAQGEPRTCKYRGPCRTAQE